MYIYICVCVYILKMYMYMDAAREERRVEGEGVCLRELLRIDIIRKSVPLQQRSRHKSFPSSLKDCRTHRDGTPCVPGCILPSSVSLFFSSFFFFFFFTLLTDVREEQRVDGEGVCLRELLRSAIIRRSVPLHQRSKHENFFFFVFTLVTGPRRWSLGLKLSDTRVCGPRIREGGAAGGGGGQLLEGWDKGLKITI